jgi:ribosomal protein S18 acetylase RimI-like enzyme
MAIAGPSPLRATHERGNFNSGSEALDNTLKHRASQDAKRGIAFPYVLFDEETGEIAGYYTLTASSIELQDLPSALAVKLPAHGVLGASLIGRLAVDLKYQRQGLGSLLVAHAVKQALHENPAASIAVVVDALNDDAVAFYKALGFILLPESGRKLFLLRETLQKHLK